MNRQMRRNLAKAGQIENVVSGAINQSYTKIRNDTIEETVNSTLAILFLILHDKYQFGAKRLNKLFDYMSMYSDGICKNEFDVGDIFAELKKIGVETKE